MQKGSCARGCAATCGYQLHGKVGGERRNSPQSLWTKDRTICKKNAEYKVHLFMDARVPKMDREQSVRTRMGMSHEVLVRSHEPIARHFHMINRPRFALQHFLFTKICLYVQFGIPHMSRPNHTSLRKFPGLLDNGWPAAMRVAKCVLCQWSPILFKAKEITKAKPDSCKKGNQIKRTMGERQ